MKNSISNPSEPKLSSETQKLVTDLGKKRLYQMRDLSSIYLSDKSGSELPFIEVTIKRQKVEEIE